MVILMVGYDINFSPYIIIGIHERGSRHNTSISFLCLFQKLCNIVGVIVLSGVDHVVELTYIEDMVLIHNDTNPILQRKSQTTTLSNSPLFN